MGVEGCGQERWSRTLEANRLAERFRRSASIGAVSTTSAGRGKRRRSKLVGHSVPWPGQGRMVGPEEPSESLIVFKSVGSAVRMSLSRRAANTTRCASTTSDVPDRASSRPTAGPSSNGCTVTCFRNAAKRACEEPSRHTCATTGWLVCKEWGASSASTTARAERSPRSTEIKKPASRITSRSALLPR